MESYNEQVARRTVFLGYTKKWLTVYIEKTIHFNLVSINVFKVQKMCLLKAKILKIECNILINVTDYFLII